MKYMKLPFCWIGHAVDEASVYYVTGVQDLPRPPAASFDSNIVLIESNTTYFVELHKYFLILVLESIYIRRYVISCY